MKKKVSSVSLWPALPLALVAMACSAAATPVFTTALSGPNAPSTTTDEITFAADVSSSDLLHGIVGTGGTWNANGATPEGLNDGNSGGDFDASGLTALVGKTWAKDGSIASFREFILGPGTGFGFDITEIQSIASWQGAGFPNQKYDVSVRYVGDALFTALTLVEYQPFPATPANNGGSTKVNVTDSTGVLASGVEAIRFDIRDTISSNGGGTVFAEIDVFGVPTPPDTTPPVISVLNPADDASNVQVGTNLAASFDEAIVAGTGNITLKRTSDDSVVEAFDVTTAPSVQLVFSGSGLTINPTNDLDPGVGYYVQIEATAIDDDTGNSFDGILDTTTWSFTTDGTAPIGTSMGPLTGATNIPTIADLTLTFDEGVRVGTGNITIHLASDGSVVETINVSSGSVIINGAGVTIDIGDLAGSTAYYVNIPAGAFEDLSGNPYAGILDTTTWSFTTSSVVTTAVFSLTQFNYEADVSNSDLLEGLIPVTTGWNLTNNASPNELTDGIHGAGFQVVPGDNVQGAWTTVGATAEYNLGLGANGLGYDIASIQSIADWVNVGFGNQGWTIEVKPVGGSYSTLATVDYQPLGNGPGTTKVTLTDVSGVLATGVEFIKVTANAQSGHVSGAFVWRELDVFGADTGNAAPLVLKIAQSGVNLNFEWNSLAGMQYDLVTSTDLTTPIGTWPVYNDGFTTYANIPNAGATTTLSGVLKDGPVRFFALIENEIPPIYSEGFEGDNGGYTIAVPNQGTGTEWAHGVPNSPTQGGGEVIAANGGTQCWGTNLTGGYLADTNAVLRSTVIDLTGVAVANLSFALSIDANTGDTYQVDVIEAGTDAVIANIIPATEDGNSSSSAWASVAPVAIPGAALGQMVRLQWRFVGAGSGTFNGAYLDDVLITAP